MDQARAQVLVALEVTKSEFPDGLPLLDPSRDMQLDTPAIRSLQERINSLTARINVSPVIHYPAPKRKTAFEIYERKLELDAKLNDLRHRERVSHMTEFTDELKLRTRVLRRMGYIDDSGLVLAKGKVACEIEAVDEVTPTSLRSFILHDFPIFSGLFCERYASNSPGVSFAVGSN
jgi:ATP-dependent RNA helicase DOB1